MYGEVGQNLVIFGFFTRGLQLACFTNPPHYRMLLSDPPCSRPPHNLSVYCLYSDSLWSSLTIFLFILVAFYRATACNATRGIAVAILSVCLSVYPSVRRVYCDKTKWRTANILMPHETAITLVFWHQQWLVDDAPSLWNLRWKWPTPPKNADFDQFPLITSQP